MIFTVRVAGRPPRRGLGTSIVSATSVPGGPLISAGGRVGGQAGELAPVDRDDQVAGLQAGAGGRRGVEHARDQQPR